MARLGSWDLTGFRPTWFDVTGNLCGWMDRDLVPCAPAPPPPPPPPPAPTRPRPSASGGNAVFPSAGAYLPPPWLRRLLDLHDECDELCETDGADFALVHLAPPEPVGAPVKALASGVVETFVDDRGRSSLVLTADDGTRYWYADVGQRIAADGDRVKAGQVIARTKPGAPPIPSIAPRGSRALLGDGETDPVKPTPPKPAQVVFVEPPPLPDFVLRIADHYQPPLTRPPEPPPAPPLRRLVKLVPIDPPGPPAETIRPPERPPSAARAIVPAAVLAAVIYLLVAFEPPRRRRR